MTYVKIGETMYPAAISGTERDIKWNDRKSKAITLEMTYEQAMKTFVDDLEWCIVYEDGENTEVYDNSEYCLAGPVTDNRDGTVTVKMGQITDGEALGIILGEV